MTDHPETTDEFEDPEAGRAAWEAETLAVAEAHGGLMPLIDGPYPGDRPQLRLTGAPAAPAAPRPHGDTETELNALIAECRLFMREIAFHSARLAPDARDRIHFIEFRLQARRDRGAGGRDRRAPARWAGRR